MKGEINMENMYAIKLGNKYVGRDSSNKGIVYSPIISGALFTSYYETAKGVYNLLDKEVQKHAQIIRFEIQPAEVVYEGGQLC